MPARPHVLLVDGHSIIFQWPELLRLHRKQRESARRRLIELLAKWGDATGNEVVVVFDGRGTKTEKDPVETRVQVFYSMAGRTADSVIERLVAKYAADFRITVATDDHLERTTVHSFGGEWISSRQLQDELDAAEAAMGETLERLRKKPPR